MGIADRLFAMNKEKAANNLKAGADFLAANKLTAILEQFAGLKWATPKTLGRKLKAKRDRVVGGLKLVCQNTNYGFVYSVAQKGNQS